MDSDEKLVQIIEGYREACYPMASAMKDDLVAIPSRILDLAKDYSQHGCINTFFMQVHSEIFALAWSNPEDFEHLCQWWKDHQEQFEEALLEI